jgi:hypothetical protein
MSYLRGAVQSVILEWVSFPVRRPAMSGEEWDRAEEEAATGRFCQRSYLSSKWVLGYQWAEFMSMKLTYRAGRATELRV